MHGQTFGLNDTCWITGFGKTKETDGEGQVLDSVCVCVCVCVYVCVYIHVCLCRGCVGDVLGYRDEGPPR